MKNNYDDTKIVKSRMSGFSYRELQGRIYGTFGYMYRYRYGPVSDFGVFLKA